MSTQRREHQTLCLEAFTRHLLSPLRSGIWYHDEEQKQIATKKVEEVRLMHTHSGARTSVPRSCLNHLQARFSQHFPSGSATSIAPGCQAAVFMILAPWGTVDFCTLKTAFSNI